MMGNIRPIGSGEQISTLQWLVSGQDVNMWDCFHLYKVLERIDLYNL